MSGYAGDLFIRVRPDLTGFNAELRGAASGLNTTTGGTVGPNAQEQRRVNGELANYTGQVRQADRATQQHTRAVQALGRESRVTGGGIASLGGAFKAGLVGFTGFAVASVGIQSVAHNLREAISGAGQLQKSGEAIDLEYGRAGDTLKRFAEGSASGLGLSAQTSEAFSAQLGVLFRNLGIGRDRAAGMTLGLQKLAGSIAAIRGVDPSTVMARLPLALAGNTRGLKALGIAIDAHAIKEKALQLGFVTTVKSTGAVKTAEQNLAIVRAEASDKLAKYGANSTQYARAAIQVEKAQQGVNKAEAGAVQTLTPAQKALAIYALATQKLGLFQSQAQKHSHDLTNEQRRLTAEWSNARDQLGKGLVPALTTVTTDLADNLPRAIHDTTTGFHLIASVLGPVVKLTGGYVRVVELLIGLKLASSLRSWVAAKQADRAATQQAAVATERDTIAVRYYQQQLTRAVGEQVIATGETRTSIPIYDQYGTAIRQVGVNASATAGELATLSGAAGRAEGTIAGAGAAAVVAGGEIAMLGNDSEVAAGKMAALTARGRGFLGVFKGRGGVLGILGAIGLIAAGGKTGGRLGSTLGDAGTGALFGSFLGPEGALAGGVAGAVFGAASAGRDQLPTPAQLRALTDGQLVQLLQAADGVERAFGKHEFANKLRKLVHDEQARRARSRSTSITSTQAAAHAGRAGVTPTQRQGQTRLTTAQQLQENLSAAQYRFNLDASKKNQAAVIAAEKALIANDEAGIRTQERLLRQHVGSAAAHTATIQQLRADVEQRRGEIDSASTTPLHVGHTHRKAKSQHAAAVRTQEATLQANVAKAKTTEKNLADDRTALHKLAGFYLRESRDADLTRAEMERYKAKYERTVKQIEDLGKKHGASTLYKTVSLEESRLRDAVSAAELKGKNTVAEERALKKLIAFDRRESHNMDLLASERETFHRRMIQAQLKLKRLREGTGSGSASDFFRQAIEDWKQFGSTLAPFAGGILSPQQARAEFSGLALGKLHVGTPTTANTALRIAEAQAQRDNAQLAESRKQTALLRALNDGQHGHVRLDTATNNKRHVTHATATARELSGLPG